MNKFSLIALLSLAAFFSSCNKDKVTPNDNGSDVPDYAYVSYHLEYEYATGLKSLIDVDITIDDNSKIYFDYLTADASPYRDHDLIKFSIADIHFDLLNMSAIVTKNEQHALHNMYGGNEVYYRHTIERGYYLKDYYLTNDRDTTVTITEVDDKIIKGVISDMTFSPHDYDGITLLDVSHAKITEAKFCVDKSYWYLKPKNRISLTIKQLLNQSPMI